MNSFQLKLIGAFEIAEQLDTTKDVLITVPASIYSVEKLASQNGDTVIRYKAKVDGAAVLAQGEKKIASHDPRKASVRLRYALMDKARRLGVDEEQYYQTEVNKIITHTNKE